MDRLAPLRIVEGRAPLIGLPAAAFPPGEAGEGLTPAAAMVRYGARRCAADIRRQDGDGPALWASRGLAEALRLVPGLPYQIRRRPGELWLGPVIGVLVDDDPQAGDPGPAGPWDLLALRYAAAGGLFFVFQREGVDTAAQLIRGYAWVPGRRRGEAAPARRRQEDPPAGSRAGWPASPPNGRAAAERSPWEAAAPRTARFRRLADRFAETVRGDPPAIGPARADPLGGGSWQEGVFPYPGAIWRRARRLPAGDPAYWTRIIGPRIFNSPLDRLTAFRRCSRFAALQPHLPGTHPVEGPDRVVDLLLRDGCAVLKPVDQAAGRGPVVLARQGRRFLVHPRGSREPERYDYLLGLEARLEALLAGDSHLVQQWVELSTYRGRRCDFRVVMQKDGRGRWQARSMVGRFGGPGEPTSDPGARGYVIPADDALQRVFAVSHREAYRLKMLVLDLCEAIAQVLDRDDGVPGEAGGVLGELELDVALDRDRRPWLLDVDPLPCHALPLYAGDEDAYLAAVSGPLPYAAHLAGFGPV